MSVYFSVVVMDFVFDWPNFVLKFTEALLYLLFILEIDLRVLFIFLEWTDIPQCSTDDLFMKGLAETSV